jgi:hypothetical protein
MSYQSNLDAELLDLATLEAERDALLQRQPAVEPAVGTWQWDQRQIDKANIARLDLYIENAKWSVAVLEKKVRA